MGDIPTTEPAVAVAGTTWQWTRDLADYPAGTWELTYHFVNRHHRFQATAAADGTVHAITVDKDTTAIQDGDYEWRAYVDNGTERHEVAAGRLTVRPDFAKQGAGYDTRSHAEIVLEAIEAVIARRATKDQMGYTLADGRRLDRTPIADLLALRGRYKAEVAREREAARIKAGLGSGRIIKTRFV